MMPMRMLLPEVFAGIPHQILQMEIIKLLMAQDQEHLQVLLPA